MNDSSEERDFLRFSTAGSVDDGKSTLIGRLLLESKAIFQDTIEAIEKESYRRGDPYVDLALYTDGLKAEREQKITIDVAYRYFATPKRKFIIADCPGHIQYTRNMVTGASTAELAIVLVDARKGVLTQSRRHCFLSTLLGIPHIVVAVNKMDLIEYSEAIFDTICEDFRDFSSKLEVTALSFIPISALHGDNIVSASPNMPWYQGSTLLHHLETVNVGSTRNQIDFRFPVQYVIRPHQDFRGFAGRISSGSIHVGAEVVVLPSGVEARVSALNISGKPCKEAYVGDSIVLELDREVDVSRGDLIVRKHNLPERSQRLDATLCWMSTDQMSSRRDYVLRLGTTEVRAKVSLVNYSIDVDTMHRTQTDSLGLNDIGRVQLATTKPLFFDTYRRNRETGAFILIDPSSNSTVAAGMLRGPSRELEEIIDPNPLKARNIVAPVRLLSLAQREQAQGHLAGVLWLTGLSGSGKTTLGTTLEKRLFESGHNVFFLDGDTLRAGLCTDLHFGEADRSENMRRAAEVAALAYHNGAIVICAVISPSQSHRDFARSRVESGRFLEVFVHCSIEECRSRDPKGLYRKVNQGQLKGFSGIDSPYEVPTRPDLLVDTHSLGVDEAVSRLIEELKGRGWTNGTPG